MTNRKLARARVALRRGKLGHNRLARAVALGILLGGASALPVAVQAADSEWTGAASEEWTDDANWVVPPVNGSFVLIDALDPNPAHLRAAAAVGPLTVGDLGQGALVIEAGAELEILGSQPAADPAGSPLGLVVANRPGSSGSVVVDGAGASLVAEFNTVVGNGGNATLAVRNGGTAALGLASAYAETIVGFGYYAWGDSREGTGYVVVDGAGSALRYAGGMNVLNGIVDVSGGGQLESIDRAGEEGFWNDLIGFGLPGSADGSFAELVGVSSVNVTGPGSAWTSVNGLGIGYGGQGTLAVSDGGSASFLGRVTLGMESALFSPEGAPTGLVRYGNGSLVVSGAGSSFSVGPGVYGSGDLEIGASGDGWVRIDSGANASLAGALTVGGGAHGALEIDSGGTMTVGGSDANAIGMTVGDAAGSDGRVSVRGAGSNLTVDAGAQIGNAGNGFIGVSDGGTVNLGLGTAYAETVLGFAYYGWGADAASGYGSLHVSGSGSTVNYAGGLNVLNGDVSVREGGQLNGLERASDGAFWIDLVGWGVPANPDVGFGGLYGGGYVDIDGEGSGWHSVNGLSVGSGGNGHVSIRNGGDASFAGMVELGDVSYVYDSQTGGPVEGIPPQAGFGMLSVSGVGSTFTLYAAPGAPEWGPGLMSVGASGGSGFVQVDNGGLLATAGGIHLGGQGHLVIGGWAEDESPLGGGTVVTPSIRIDEGGSLQFRHDGYTNLGAALSGSGWLGANGGHTELSGDSSGFAGDIGINNGAVVEVTGALGADYLDIGYEGAGTLLVNNGGSFHAIAASVGSGLGGSGSVVVDGAGSSFSTDGWTSIGRDGSGSLGVFAGATANLAMTEWYTETTLGFGEYGWTEHAEQGVGSIVVDGAGSTLNYAGGLNVLNGSVQVTDGGTVAGHSRGDTQWVDVIGWGVPADPDPAHGFAGLYGMSFAGIGGEGSSWHSANMLSVGEGGTGAMHVADGADASFSGYARLGTISYLYDGETNSPRLDVAPATGHGSLLVSGAGSSFDVNALEGEESWQQGDLYVGYSAGSTGEVTIADGATSDIDGRLVVGRRGTGFVGVADGGSMSVHGADEHLMGMVLGDSAGSHGEVVVGNGATLEIAGGAQIGDAGTGMLAVVDGGAVEIGLETAFSETLLGFGYYGWGEDAASGHGTILVEGGGSTLTYGGGLNVLNGSMTVSDGGQVASQAREADGAVTWLDLIGFGVPADPVPEHGFAGLYGEGTVVVTGDGSAWNSVNGLSVGNGGSGMLAVLDGGSASFVGNGYVGTQGYLFDAATGQPVEGLAGQPGSGTIRVEGEGSAFTLAAAGEGTGVLHVAYGGDGGLEVRDGGSATVAGGIEVGANGYVLVGGGGDEGGPFAAAGMLATPSVTLADPGAILAFAHSTEGYAFDGSILGTGQLLVGGDTTLSGDSSAFAGNLLVEGAPLTVTGALGAGLGLFGLEGGASLAVTDGGSVHFTGNDGGFSAVFGAGIGSEALATVSGAGSRLVADGGVQIGAAGTAGLQLLDGATASFGLAHAYSEVLLGLGYYGSGEGAAEGVGSLHVDGAGSALHYAGGLNVLNGEALVSNGGLLQSHERDSDDAFWIDVVGLGIAAATEGGEGVGGTGEVTLVGPGTSWQSVNALLVGVGGTGFLSVLDGASAHFTGFAEFGSDSATNDANGNPVSVAPGTGTLLVSGADSNFTVAAVAGNASLPGVLSIGTGGTGTAFVNDGGTIAASAIEVGDGGALVVGGAADGGFAGAGTIAAPVSLVGADATLAFLHADGDYIFDTAISGDGFIHAGHGFTMLTADSSAFGGYTLVDGGATLSVNGSLGGDLMVATDGRLQGSGTVGNLTVAGTLAPGNSPGTLSISGDLVMETGSVFEAEIDSATGEYDAIAVTGNVSISEGTVLSVTKLGDAQLAPGTSIDLIQTSETTTVEGQFSEVTGGSDFLGYGVDYSGGEINLNVTRSLEVTFEGAAGADFGGLGKALDGLDDDNALMKMVFLEVTSKAEAQQVLADMAGTMHADLRRELVDGSRHLRGAVIDRLATAPASGSGFWAHALTDQGDMDAEGMWPSVEIRRTGLLVGYDMDLGATRLGAAIGTGNGDYDADGKAVNADLRDRHMSLYGSSDLGAVRLGYGLGVSWTGIETERSFAIGDVSQRLSGDRDARTDQVFVEAARRLGTVEHRFLEPYVSVSHVRAHDDGFAEQGGLAALAVDGDVASATFANVGARWALGGERMQWTGSVGMRYARGFDHGAADARFTAGGDSFPIRGLSLDGSAIDISMGARFRVSGRVHAWAGYESLIGGNSRNDGLKLQISVDL